MNTLIKTASQQPSGAKATIINSGKGTVISSAYQGFVQFSKAYGFYQDVKPYLPDTYLKKYTYKPHKRVAGYLGQAFHAKKRSSSSGKYYKKLRCGQWGNWNNNFCRTNLQRGSKS